MFILTTCTPKTEGVCSSKFLYYSLKLLQCVTNQAGTTRYLLL